MRYHAPMRFTIVVLGMAVLVPLPPARAHDPIATKVTWSREIRPLVQRRCIACHTPGGFAFPLTTYAEARPWAVAIKEETLAGIMPPWGAAAGIGHFANDRRLTRHEIELIAAWVDGGAPQQLPGDGTPVPPADPAAPAAPTGTRVPLANAVIEDATNRTASVTLQVPAGLTLTAWSFEPGTPAIVERVELELGTRALGTWTPGDASLAFPANAGVALGSTALFTARITYRAPETRVVDYSGIRIWTTKEPRPMTVRETTIVRSWRAPHAVHVFALRPTGSADVEVVAHFPNGRIEPLGVFAAPPKAPHPTYRLTEPLALPAGGRLDVTGAVRLLYTEPATRTVKPNVRRRPRR